MWSCFPRGVLMMCAPHRDHSVTVCQNKCEGQYSGGIHPWSSGSVARVKLILVICRLAPTHIDSNEPPHLVAMATKPLSGQIAHIMRSCGDLHHDRTAVYFNVAQNGIPTQCRRTICQFSSHSLPAKHRHRGDVSRTDAAEPSVRCPQIFAFPHCPESSF